MFRARADIAELDDASPRKGGKSRWLDAIFDPPEMKFIAACRL